MKWPLLENQVRAQYKLLRHEGLLTRVRCQDVNQDRQISEQRVRGVNEIIEWAHQYNTRGNLFIGRNPVDETGKVCRVNNWSLDIDPVRPPKTASSPDQLLKALRVSEQIRRRFYGDGYLCSSGNGGLLLFPLPGLEVDDLQLFAAKCRTLEGIIRDKFQTEEVKIDATFDVARLVKLLGSVSTKGDVGSHRYARFITPPIFRAKRSRILDELERVNVPQSVTVLQLVSQADIQTTNGVSDPGLVSVDETRRLGPAARLDLAEKSLNRINPVRCDDYDNWLKCGIALKEFGPVGFELWRNWTLRCHTKDRERFSTEGMSTKWNSFRADQSLTVGTLKYWADLDSPRVQLGPSMRTVPEPGRKLWTPGDSLAKPASAGIAGISTGFRWLDGKFNGGYRPGVVYAVEACTNVGKSAYIIQAAVNCCQASRRVLLVTTEASIEEVCQRYWAVGTGIPASKICNGSLTDDGRKVLGDYQDQFRASHQLGIWYTVSPKTEEIERQISEFKPDILLWDYFQHFETGTESRQIQLGSLARWFESTALKYQIPLVVAAQLHERYDFKNRKRLPAMKDDIKDCKVLNDAAKTVIVLDWDQRHQTSEDGPVLVTLDIQKNKGPMAQTKLLLRRDITRFEEI